MRALDFLLETRVSIVRLNLTMMLILLFRYGVARMVIVPKFGLVACAV